MGWEALRERWAVAAEAVVAERDLLCSRYGPQGWRWAKAAERKRLEALERREEKAKNTALRWLEQHSPRCWEHGVPLVWIRTSLDFLDARTEGALSVTPPPAYGHTEREMEAFAAPLPQK